MAQPTSLADSLGEHAQLFWRHTGLITSNYFKKFLIGMIFEDFRSLGGAHWTLTFIAMFSIKI